MTFNPDQRARDRLQQQANAGNGQTHEQPIRSRYWTLSDIEQLDDPEWIVALMRAQLTMIRVVDRNQGVDPSRLGGVELALLKLSPVSR